jgi:hypothetical protein
MSSMLVSCYKPPEEEIFQAADRLNDATMKCQRCLSSDKATYLVCSDALVMAVCATCANEARRLGLTVEPLS